MRWNKFYVGAIILAILILIFFWEIFVVLLIIGVIGYFIFKGITQNKKWKLW